MDKEYIVFHYRGKKVYEAETPEQATAWIIQQKIPSEFYWEYIHKPYETNYETSI